MSTRRKGSTTDASNKFRLGVGDWVVFTHQSLAGRKLTGQVVEVDSTRKLWEYVVKYRYLYPCLSTTPKPIGYIIEKIDKPVASPIKRR